MPRVTEEQKRLFFELYKQGFRGQHIAKCVGIDTRYAKNIVLSFDDMDYSWLESGYNKYHETIPESEKVRIVMGIRERSLTTAEAVHVFNVPYEALQRWKRNYNKYGVCSRRRGRPRKDGSDGFGEEEQATREREQIAARRDYYLQNILPYLCGKRDGPSKKKTLRAIGECRGLGIPLRRCLEVLKLSSSTYHYWRKHESDLPGEDMMLADSIRAIQEGCHWAYGAKRMAKTLVREGIVEAVNHKHVARLMKAYGLNARIRRRRYPKNYYLTLRESSDNLPRNDLARDFKADRPFEKLVTDITYLPTTDGWLYLAAVKDLWNNEIVSHRFSRQMSLNLVRDVVLGIDFRGSDPKDSMLHSDMGWTYTHISYVSFLKGLGIHQSMSRKGNCWDNACIENFFGLMKSETIKQTKHLLAVDEMVKLIDDYIHWYNNQRIQKKLGYLSPVDFRKLAT